MHRLDHKLCLRIPWWVTEVCSVLSGGREIEELTPTPPFPDVRGHLGNASAERAVWLAASMFVPALVLEENPACALQSEFMHYALTRSVNHQSWCRCAPGWIEVWWVGRASQHMTYARNLGAGEAIRVLFRRGVLYQCYCGQQGRPEQHRLEGWDVYGASLSDCVRRALQAIRIVDGVTDECAV